MKKTESLTPVLLVVTVIVSIIFISCSSSGGGSQSWTTPADISGTWVCTDFPDVGGPDTSIQSHTLVLNQNGARVSGTDTTVYDSGRTATSSFSGTYLNGVLTESGGVTLYYRFTSDTTMYAVDSPDADSGIIRYSKR